jgi:hypothetical protein
MCIAILSPKGTQLSKETLNICWLNNFNGAGFMYNDDNNKLHTVKEMKDFDKFYSKYADIRDKFPNSTMVLHFRISTHGVINRTNCHPFKVNNKLGFVHNGIIREVEKDKKYSDTNMFNRTVLRKIPGLDISMLKSKGMKKLMGHFIDYSKLVFMDNMNNYAIINEQKGHWAEGIWYSNDSYKKVKDTIDYGGQTRSRSSFSSGSSTGYGTYGGYRGSSGRSWEYTGSQNTPGYTQSSMKEDLKMYKISDGTDTCDCCGIPLMQGEVVNMFGECLDCLNQDEATEVLEAVLDDNHILTNLNGTVTTDSKTDGTGVKTESTKRDPYDFTDTVDKGNSVTEYSECDYCTTVLEKENIRHLPEHDAKLCKGCIENMVDHGYLTKDKLDIFKDKTEA